MTRRNRQLNDLEARLRANRPEPAAGLVRSLLATIVTARRDSRRTVFRGALAAAVTLVFLGMLASFGGFGYAASGTVHALKAVHKTVVSVKAPKRTIVRNSGRQTEASSSADDQYAQERVTICHHAGPNQRVTITVAAAALPAHLAHGDTIGPCP